MDVLAAIGWPVVDRVHLGPLAISPHGVGIAVGYLAGSWWMIREGKKRGLSEENIGTMVLWALVGAIVGARFFYVLGHAGEFDGVVDMLAVWRGGISLIGGIVGAILATYPLMRRFGYRFTQVMDPAAIGLAFGIAVGRIGDLIIGDHLGTHTDFFLGFRYSGGDLAGYACTGEGAQSLCITTLTDGTIQTVEHGDVVHQTALYDLLIASALFLLLWWLNRRPRREGVLISTFAIWYGAGRVITDFLRVDKTWLGLTGSQWTSIAAIVVSVIALARWARRPVEPAPVEEAEPQAAERSLEDVSTTGEPPVSEERPTTAFRPPPEPDGSVGP